jgi:hypothetical protein
MLAFAVVVFCLIACGGGGSSPTTPTTLTTPATTSSTAGQAQGVYDGTTSTSGETFEAIVLPNDKFYALYGTTVGNVFIISGMVEGQGASGSSTYSAPSVTDFYYTGSPTNGSITASYVPGVSLRGTLTEPSSVPPVTTFSGAAIPSSEFNYNTTASLSAISGAWTGALLDNVAATVTINSNGSLSGSSSGCSFSGTVVADSSNKNFFDVTLTYGGSPCLLPNQTASGIGVDYLLSDGVTSQLLAAVNTGTSAGNVFVATRVAPKPVPPPVVPPVIPPVVSTSMLTPNTVSVTEGATQQFTLTTSVSTAWPVIWIVIGDGSIPAAGQYSGCGACVNSIGSFTAGSTPGTATVEVMSAANQNIILATAIVTVTANPSPLGPGTPAPISSAANTAPVILVNPVSVTVADGTPAVFSIVATGTPPLVYEWYEGHAASGNGILSCDSVCVFPTTGNYSATGGTFSAPGEDISVSVSNAYGFVNATEVTLIVTAPAPPPLTLNTCVALVCPWEISVNGGAIIQANLTVGGTIVVDGPIYYEATLGGWPQDYPVGTPGIAPSNQYDIFSLSGTTAPSSIVIPPSTTPSTSISMLYAWTNDTGSTPWQYQFTGTYNSLSNAASGIAAWDGLSSGIFTGAERIVGLPAAYSGTLAVYANGCLNPGVILSANESCQAEGSDAVQVAFAMDANFNITATVVATGFDNGTYMLSGPMIGNTLQLSGILGNQQVELVAYFDVKGIYGGPPQSLIFYQLPYPISAQQTAYMNGYNGTLNPTK